MDLSILDKKEIGETINQEKLLQFPIKLAKSFFKKKKGKEHIRKKG